MEKKFLASIFFSFLFFLFSLFFFATEAQAAKSYSLVQTTPAGGYWYKYDSVGGGSWTNTSGDLFPDSASVDDYIALDSRGGIGWVTFTSAYFSSAYITVDTAFAADSVTFIWEYYATDETWKALTNVSDGTNDLTQTGQVTWDIPTDWATGGVVSAAVNVRCRISAVTNPSEGGNGYPKLQDFYISASGGTSGDPVTFDDIYDYIINTLGRSDLASQDANRVDQDSYVFRVNLKTADYFSDSYTTVEWVGVGFWLDDNADLSYTHHYLRRTAADVDFKTDGTFEYNIFVQDSLAATMQRAVSFAGTGTYNWDLFRLKSLTRVPSTITLNNCQYDGATWIGVNITGGVVDFNDTDFGSSTNYSALYGGTMKNFTMSGTIHTGSGRDQVFVNTDYNPTSWASGANTGDKLHFKWEFDLKIVDVDGSILSGATVQIEDEDSSRAEVHAALSADVSSGQKVVTLDDTSRFSNGDTITLSVDMENEESATIDTVDSATQITVTANLSNAHKTGALVRNTTSQDLTTDASGDIYTQALTEKVLTGTGGGFSTSTKEDHTVTISKTGYRTKTVIYTMDQKRTEVETLEQAVSGYVNTPAHLTGMAKVLGTEYDASDNTAAVYAQVLDQYGTPATGATATLTVYDRDGDIVTGFDGVSMDHIANGIYRYKMTTPATEGTYVASVVSSSPTAYGVGDFHVAPWANRIASSSTIASDVWANSTRTLSTFGTLVTDVWANSTRTLTALGSSLTAEIWDSLTSGMTTAGSIGSLLATNIDAAISTSGATAATIWSYGTRVLTSTKVGSTDMAATDKADVSDLATKTDVADLATESLIDDLEAKIDSLKVLAVLNRSLMEKVANAPQIKVWYEKGSIILKAQIRNPSNSLTQTVEFKQKLPREVKPEHIEDYDGLQAKYDSIDEVYYLYGDFELLPQEAIEKSVKIKNVWQIASSETQGLKKSAVSSVELLKKSSYFAQASMLLNDIETRLDGIIEKQEKAVTPEEYITVYRENLADLSIAKKNFETLNGLVLAWEGEKKVIANIGGIQVTATWGIILAIVVGLSLLGMVNFSFLGQARKGKVGVSLGVFGGSFSKVLERVRFLSLDKLSRRLPFLAFILSFLVGVFMASYFL